MYDRIISYTSSNLFKTCRAKYNYSINKELKPLEVPTYFAIGGAFHVALEKHYQGEIVNDIIQAINKFFEKSKPGEKEIDKMIDWKDSRQLVINMYQNYRKHYPLENEPFKVFRTEVKFDSPITNYETGEMSEEFGFSGRIDGVVIEDGKYWLLEHKTAASISENYKRALRMDTQSIAYLDAAQQFLEKKIEGVIYNVALKSVPHPPEVLKKGNLSKNKQANTTYELYLEKIKELNLDPNDYADHLEYLQTNQKTYFYRKYLVFPPDAIDIWRKELWQIQEDILDAEKKDKWYKNTWQCNAMGTCQYFDICTAVNKQEVIAKMYKKHVSHPELEELPPEMLRKMKEAA